ncbi:MAG: hypothetical protein JNL67_01840 [Planctomycetaceae bacterium]|nr:hypothetical protein [Planctomycetaceae bacterium]
MERRTRLAWGFGVSCVLLLSLWFATPFDQGTSKWLFAFFLKLTLMVGVLWLAWPDLARLGQRLPPRFVILAIISLAMVLIQPRVGQLLILLTLVYWAGWWLYKKFYPNRSNHRGS